MRREVRVERRRRTVVASAAKWGALFGAIGVIFVLRQPEGEAFRDGSALLVPIGAVSGALYGSLIGLGVEAMLPDVHWREFSAGSSP